MGFRTTIKCPQKGKKKVWAVKNSKGLSEILVKQSSPQLLLEDNNILH